MKNLDEEAEVRVEAGDALGSKLTTQRDSRWRWIVACLFTHLFSVLVSFCQFDTYESHLGRENLSWGTASIKLACANAFGGLFTIDWCGKSQSTVGSTLPEQGVLGCIRKTTEEAMGSRLGSSVSWWSLFQFLPPGSFLGFSQSRKH